MHDVHTALGELLRIQTLTIEYLPGRTYRAKAPCRLARLAAHIGASTGSGGGRAPTASSTLVDADALDLWTAIVGAAYEWAAFLRVDIRPYHGGTPTGTDTSPLGRWDTPPVGRLLRQVAQRARDTGHPAVVDRITHDAYTWARRIDALLGGTVATDSTGRLIARREATDLYGRTCPVCDTRHVVEERDGDGRYRVTALQLRYADLNGEQHPYWWCRACQAWSWLSEHDAGREQMTA
jgi:hypothetical protein